MSRAEVNSVLLNRYREMSLERGVKVKTEDVIKLLNEIYNLEHENELYEEKNKKVEKGKEKFLKSKNTIDRLGQLV